jgi:catechol 2,3-dioxygenase-like lactoylglutathione lyase family enzyme
VKFVILRPNDKDFHVKWSRRAGILRLYDHIDLRVRNLAEARTFYEVLLPALGFTRETSIPDWCQYEAAAPDGGPATFFGVTESPGHVANESRIAFWARNPAEVDRLAWIATRAGAQNVEGPGWEDETYYAVFFEDPSGNRLEICHRTGPVKVNN